MFSNSSSAGSAPSAGADGADFFLRPADAVWLVEPPPTESDLLPRLRPVLRSESSGSSQSSAADASAAAAPAGEALELHTYAKQCSYAKTTYVRKNNVNTQKK